MAKIHTLSEIADRLFFTKDDELDTGQAILILCCLTGITIFILQSFGLIVGPSVAFLTWYGSFTSLAFIAGAARDRAKLIANSKVPGDVAEGIARAPQNLPFKPNEWIQGDPQAGIM